MFDFAVASLETAKVRGASYADARVMHLRQRDLTTKNGEVGTLAQSESIGLGIRVLANGANVRTQQRVDSAERTRREICSCAGRGPRFPMRDVLGSPSG